MRVVGECRVHRLAERDRLAGDDVFERAALPAGEDGLVDRLGVLLRAQDATAARTAQRLVGRERDHVGVRDGIRVGTTGDESGEMGDVEQQQRADFVRDLLERLGIEASGVRRRARDDQLRTVLQGELTHLVHLDAILGPRAVRDEVVQQPARVDR